MSFIARIVKLLLFYTIFYTILAGFSALCFYLFMKTLDDNVPKWQLEKSLIGNNPGLTFRPIGYDNTIIFNKSDPASLDFWIEQLDEFLEPYLSTKRSENVQACYNQHWPEHGRVCDFKLLVNFVPCVRQYGYGFDFDNSEKGPCIFLKLNKIYGWTPEFYTRDTIPSNMPQHLVEIVKNSEMKNEQNRVWVDCAPINPTDGDLMGPVSYYPQNGFDGNYFPYLNIPGYLSPLVAVHFEKPKRGVLIKVECRAWAANIRHDLKSHQGVVRFALLIN